MYDKPLNFEDQRSEAEELEIPIHLTLTSETPLQFSLKRPGKFSGELSAPYLIRLENVRDDDKTRIKSFR
jgi:hypothetical protein